jgi:hypothetical protein
MNAFIVELENKPGELARITEPIASRGINILGLTGSTCGSSGSVVLYTNDEGGTRTALASAGVHPREVELVVASMPHQPGAFAEIARKLSDAGINIEAVLPTGMDGGNMNVALATDNPSRARELIGQRVGAGAHN